MIQAIGHDLQLPASRDQRSRQEFVAALRSHVLGDMAEHMRQRYHERYADDPAESEARDGTDVHETMQSDPYFRFYSAIRLNAQEMVFRSVIPVVEQNIDELNGRAAALRNEAHQQPALRDDFEIPRSVADIDVHLAPGSYHTEYADSDTAAGAIYDNSINVFAFNQMGRHVDDIGHTMSNYVRLTTPELQPKRILDCGCTVGHNTVPWKQTFPQAEVHGIDRSILTMSGAALTCQCPGIGKLDLVEIARSVKIGDGQLQSALVCHCCSTPGRQEKHTATLP